MGDVHPHLFASSCSFSPELEPPSTSGLLCVLSHGSIGDCGLSASHRLACHMSSSLNRQHHPLGCRPHCYLGVCCIKAIVFCFLQRLVLCLGGRLRSCSPDYIFRIIRRSLANLSPKTPGFLLPHKIKSSPPCSAAEMFAGCRSWEPWDRRTWSGSGGLFRGKPGAHVSIKIIILCGSAWFGVAVLLPRNGIDFLWSVTLSLPF